MLDSETERKAANVVAKCIEQSMWLEAAELGHLIFEEITMWHIGNDHCTRSAEYCRLFATHITRFLGRAPSYQAQLQNI